MAMDEPPWARVIAKFGFSPLPYIENKAFISAFCDALRAHYPTIQQNRYRDITDNSYAGSRQTAAIGEHKILWSLTEQAQTWRILLAQEFIIIETSAYTGRDAFAKHIDCVIDALYMHLKTEYFSEL